MLQKSQVTEDFSCPFCMVRCASFKGLERHLRSSHDLFHFECEANEGSQVVVVSVKHDASEIVGIADPRKQTFLFCHKPLRRRVQNQNANDVGPRASGSRTLETLCVSRGGVRGAPSAPDIIFARPAALSPSVPENSIAPTAILHSANASHQLLRRRGQNQNANDVDPHPSVSHTLEPLSVSRGASRAPGIIFARPTAPAPSVPESSIAPTAMLKNARHKPLRSRGQIQNANDVGLRVLVSGTPETPRDSRGVAGVSGAPSTIFARPTAPAPSLPESSIAPTAILQFTNSRKRRTARKARRCSSRS